MKTRKRLGWLSGLGVFVMIAFVTLALSLVQGCLLFLQVLAEWCEECWALLRGHLKDWPKS